MRDTQSTRPSHLAAILNVIVAMALAMPGTRAIAADNASLLAALHAPDDVVVAPWTGAADRTLVMWAVKAKDDPKRPDFGAELYDFHLRVAQTSTGRVLQRQDQRHVFTSDANHFDGVTFDMADLALADRRPAFAVRVNYSHQGCDSMAQSDLRLYQVVQGRLRQVFNQSEFDKSQGTCDCSGAEESEGNLHVAPGSTNGQADLLRGWHEIVHNERMVGEECVDHPAQQSGNVRLRFNGEMYRE